MRRSLRSRRGQPRAQFSVVAYAIHSGRNRGRVPGIELQGRIRGDAGHRLDRRAARGDPRRQRLYDRSPKPSNNVGNTKAHARSYNECRSSHGRDAEGVESGRALRTLKGHASVVFGVAVTRRDRTQVQSCIRYAAERDAAGILKRDFAKPGTLDAATLAKVENEEGWILWV